MVLSLEWHTGNFHILSQDKDNLVLKELLIEEGKDPKDFALSLFTDTVDLDKNWANLHLMSIKLRHKTPDLIATYAVIVPYHTNIIESYWLSINKINSDFLYNHELNKALYKI